MLSWIPLLGPILQGLASIATPFFNEKGVAVKAAADVTVAETEASVQIIQATKDDIGLRILRDAIILPVAVWSMLMGWDTIVAKHYPNLMWHTAGFPPSVQYIPYAVIVFLFGNIGLNMWNRK